MNYTYSKYVSIIDIVIIILAIIFIILGAKKGFLQKAIKIANWVFGILFAVVFCVQFANDVLYNLFGETLKTTFYNNIMSNETFKSLQTSDDYVAVLKSLGIPEFLGKIVCQNIDTTSVCESIAQNLSSCVTSACLIVISFFTLWIGTSLICLILKLLAKIMRTSLFVRIIDGILGVVLYLIMLFVIVEVVFFVVVIIYRNCNIEPFNTFIDNDVLGIIRTYSFSISKYFFNNNFLANLIALLF